MLVFQLVQMVKERRALNLKLLADQVRSVHGLDVAEKELGTVISALKDQQLLPGGRQSRRSAI
jgi:hypothetical protein